MGRARQGMRRAACGVRAPKKSGAEHTNMKHTLRVRLRPPPAPPAPARPLSSSSSSSSLVLAASTRSPTPPRPPTACELQSPRNQ
eukprot:1307443-Rhodomonas_salina.2